MMHAPCASWKQEWYHCHHAIADFCINRYAASACTQHTLPAQLQNVTMLITLISINEQLHADYVKPLLLPAVVCAENVSCGDWTLQPEMARLSRQHWPTLQIWRRVSLCFLLPLSLSSSSCCSPSWFCSPSSQHQAVTAHCDIMLETWPASLQDLEGKTLLLAILLSSLNCLGKLWRLIVAVLR